jgi:nitrous oxide reductase accessory protein NosL
MAASLSAGWQPRAQVWLAEGEEPLFVTSAVDLLADWLLDNEARLPVSLVASVV